MAVAVVLPALVPVPSPRPLQWPAMCPRRPRPLLLRPPARAPARAPAPPPAYLSAYEDTAPPPAVPPAPATGGRGGSVGGEASGPSPRRGRVRDRGAMGDPLRPFARPSRPCPCPCPCPCPAHRVWLEAQPGRRRPSCALVRLQPARPEPALRRGVTRPPPPPPPCLFGPLAPLLAPCPPHPPTALASAPHPGAAAVAGSIIRTAGAGADQGT